MAHRVTPGTLATLTSDCIILLSLLLPSQFAYRIHLLPLAAARGVLVEMSERGVCVRFLFAAVAWSILVCTVPLLIVETRYHLFGIQETNQ